VGEKYQLSKKEKMLAAALYARQLKPENVVAVLMALQSDDDVDDMVWYLGQHPNAMDEELVAVAYQIAKDSGK